MKLKRFLSVFTVAAIIMTLCATCFVMAVEETGDDNNEGNTPVETVAEYTVTFDANGGTGDGEETTVVLEEKFLKDSSFVAIENPFKNGDYPFLSWNTKKGGDGVTIMPNETIVFDDDLIKNCDKKGNLVLYATWQKGTSEDVTNTYYSNFPNGEEEQIKTDIVMIGGFGSTIDNPFFCDGYKFVGWTTSADGSGEIYGELDSYAETVETAMTFYAQWESENEYEDYDSYDGWENPDSGSTSHIAVSALGLAIASLGVAFALKKNK